MTTSMTKATVKAKNLIKKYNDFTAVDGISFEINEGEIVGLVGPNGAGKTTTIQILLALLKPDAGEINIFGKNLEENKEQILEKTNFAAPYCALPYNLTPEENLIIFSMLYGFKDARERSLRLLREFGLMELRKRRTGSLSSGEQMKLSLAKAFLNEPKLLLLDEPTAFLDPAVAKEVRNHIYEKMKIAGAAILWTSHNMLEVEKICDRVIFLFKGKIIAEGKPKDLKKQFKKADLEDVFISLAKGNKTYELFKD